MADADDFKIELTATGDKSTCTPAGEKINVAFEVSNVGDQPLTGRLREHLVGPFGRTW